MEIKRGSLSPKRLKRVYKIAQKRYNLDDTGYSRHRKAKYLPVLRKIEKVRLAKSPLHVARVLARLVGKFK